MLAWVEVVSLTVCSPVPNKLGEITGWNTKASTHVDQEVKPQHDRSDRLLGVNNHLLAALGLDDMGNLVGRLVHDGGRNVGFELKSQSVTSLMPSQPNF